MLLLYYKYSSWNWLGYVEPLACTVMTMQCIRLRPYGMYLLHWTLLPRVKTTGISTHTAAGAVSSEISSSRLIHWSIDSTKSNNIITYLSRWPLTAFLYPIQTPFHQSDKRSILREAFPRTNHNADVANPTTTDAACGLALGTNIHGFLKYLPIWVGGLWLVVPGIEVYKDVGCSLLFFISVSVSVSFSFQACYLREHFGIELHSIYFNGILPLLAVIFSPIDPSIHPYTRHNGPSFDLLPGFSGWRLRLRRAGQVRVRQGSGWRMQLRKNSCYYYGAEVFVQYVSLLNSVFFFFPRPWWLISYLYSIQECAPLDSAHASGQWLKTGL